MGNRCCKSKCCKYEKSVAPKGDPATKIEIMELVKTIPLFSKLAEYQHEKMAESFETMSYPAGRIVVKQGTVGDLLFLISSGKARVDVGSQGTAVTVAMLGKGNYFGENALIRKGEKRNATVVAEERLVCFVLSRHQFVELGIQLKVVDKRCVIMADVSGQKNTSDS